MVNWVRCFCPLYLDLKILCLLSIRLYLDLNLRLNKNGARTLPLYYPAIFILRHRPKSNAVNNWGLVLLRLESTLSSPLKDCILRSLPLRFISYKIIIISGLQSSFEIIYLLSTIQYRKMLENIQMLQKHKYSNVASYSTTKLS